MSYSFDKKKKTVTVVSMNVQLNSNPAIPNIVALMQEFK